MKYKLPFAEGEITLALKPPRIVWCVYWEARGEVRLFTTEEKAEAWMVKNSHRTKQGFDLMPERLN